MTSTSTQRYFKRHGITWWKPKENIGENLSEINLET